MGLSGTITVRGIHGLLITLFITVSLLSSACMDSVEYDIEETADSDYVRGIDQQHEEIAEGDSCAVCSTEDTVLQGVEHDHDHDHEAEQETMAESGLHLHDQGERNHGTEWFFNQPWAATFIWPKMLMHTVILVLLAAGVLVASSLLQRRRR